MDNFNEIYASMFNNTVTPENEVVCINQAIIDKLIKHINQVISFLDQNIRKSFIDYLFLIKSQGYNINDFINIQCVDQIKNKYELILKNLKTDFYVLHSSQLQYLKKGAVYNNGFYCGNFDNVPTSEAIYISLTPIKFKNSYLINKRKLARQKKKEQSTMFKPKQQTINDVFLQYVGYFRNR